MEENANKKVSRVHTAVIPVQNQNQDQTEPENDIAPARTDRSDGAVTLVLHNAAGAAPEERADTSKKKQQNKKKSMEVVMPWPGMNKKVPIKNDHNHNAGKLCPKHLFLKTKTGHTLSMSKIFDIENTKTIHSGCQTFLTLFLHLSARGCRNRQKIIKSRTFAEPTKTVILSDPEQAQRAEGESKPALSLSKTSAAALVSVLSVNRPELRSPEISRRSVR
jgi:hypothetical protein